MVQSSVLPVLQPFCVPSATCMRNITWQHRVKTGIAGSFNRNKSCIRLHLKCDGTNAETRFCLSAKRTSPFTLVGTSVQSTTGRRAVQGLYCSCKPVFCSHMTLTGYPLHSLVSPSLLLPCITMCHHISNAVFCGLSTAVTDVCFRCVAE